MSTSKFSLSYQVEKGISESLSIERIANFLVSNPIYLAALVILIILTLIYRKELKGLISESFAGEEEVIEPKKEL